jgi:glucokinase
MNAADALLPRLQRAVERGAPIPPLVAAAQHTFDAPLVGALLLAADALGDRWTPPDHDLSDRDLAIKELA